jgi:hypothetical protein
MFGRIENFRQPGFRFPANGGMLAYGGFPDYGNLAVGIFFGYVFHMCDFSWRNSKLRNINNGIYRKTAIDYKRSPIFENKWFDRKNRRSPAIHIIA